MLLRWFPDRRGLITGLAVAGFGLGAAVTGPLSAQLITTLHVGPTLVYLGIAYTIIAVIAAQFFRAAPDNYRPAGWTAPTTVRSSRTQRDYTLSEALRTPSWYLLWLMLTLDVVAGAALISVAAPLAQEFVGIGAVAAAFIVLTNSFFNAGGRLFWSWLSESISRPYTFLSIFVIQLFAFILLAVLPHPVNYVALIIVEGFSVLCYGGGFGTMPAYTADVFGARNSGAIYGVMLTSWSVGSVIGPQLITLVTPRTTALYVIAVLMLISCILPFIARLLTRRQNEAEVSAVPAERMSV
jgi:OFA family oxalate/formate antiporter-like MFS transporter